MKDESPQGRRVNVWAADRPDAPEPGLGVQAFERIWTSDDLLAYPRSLPVSAVPRVVVLDNAGLHVSEAVRAERPALPGRGIDLDYLPA